LCIAYTTTSIRLYFWRINDDDDTTRYDTKEEFNVDSKAECDQLNLAHVVSQEKYEKEK